MARTRRIVFVRHAQVELRPDVPAVQWQLTADGREAAARLAQDSVFDGVHVVVSSPEPKAVATAQPIAARHGVPVQIDRDLRESERPDLPILPDDEHRELVGRYLSGEALSGWESQEIVRVRMRAAIERLDGDAVVISHGRALALLLGLTPEAWAALPLPAVVAVWDEGRGYLGPRAG